jgi:Xaa-Pro aminopeptidase
MVRTTSGPGLSVEQRDLFRARRERVMSALGPQGALLLWAAPELRVGDTELRYLVDPDLYYLTGYREPEAVLVLAPGHESPFTMFVRARDQERERWSGARGGPQAAVSDFGAHAAFTMPELAERLPTLLHDVDVLYARIDDEHSHGSELVRRIITQGRRSRPRTGKGVHTLSDPGVLLDELRVRKDPVERALLRQAAEISVAAFGDVIELIAPGRGEWEIEAALEAGFRKRGADGCAFPSIVAGGANATVLHYVSNQDTLKAGDLVLIDAGARYQMYCGDISRTFPVSGTFSPVQRTLYDAVLAAHDAALAVARPGATVADLQQAALHALLPVLKRLNLLEGKTVEAALADETSYKKFFPHKVSHWLGLDVHDVGAYAFRSGARPLEAGMVLTVEPGLYIPCDCLEAPVDVRGTAVRLEDDLLITEGDCEVLTAGLPIRADEIERLMRRGSV